MKVSEIGEFGLIKRLSRMADKAENKEREAWRRLIAGIGDDATAYLSDNSIQMATVDSLVQDIHFSLSYTKWEELGWKSLAVNLSDIAAMGGLPLYALVSLGLPGSTDVEDVITLYKGMLELANKCGVAIVGGDTVSSPFVFISVTVLGSAGANNKHLLRRSAAKPGEQIAVTNYLGASAAGLAMLTKHLKFASKSMAQLGQAHLKPFPRLTEGRLLVENSVKCGMDISDGLVGDLTHICQESKVGAQINIDLVPVAAAVKECFGKQALELALTGGEDYELLFTASPRVMNKVKKTIPCPVTVIGEITAEKVGRVTLVDSQGKQFNLKKTGWDHFTNNTKES
ncbi:MAG: thiamine-phosphate kinase [Dehalococcoidales bacterium]|nr:thiamine-phosphate kinase [Dehalococcoidales bacterium]